MADEGVLFEGLRLGSTNAFEALLLAEGATMRRVARLYVSDARVDLLVRQTWSVALPGLDMFSWQTSLRTWLTGILVTYGRAWGAGSPVPVPGRVMGAGDASSTGDLDALPATGPATCLTQAATSGTGAARSETVPWRSLAWSSWWDESGWQALEAALWSQPTDRLEVLWLHDLEQWPLREVLDTLGLTAAHGELLLRQGRDQVADAVARHLGQALGTAGAVERSEAVPSLLAGLRPSVSELHVDPALSRLFIIWRRRRGVRAWRRWRWELTSARVEA